MTTLTTGHIEDLGADRKLHYLDESTDFNAVALEIEYGLVLPEVMGVEGRLPPLRSRTQKNTGSLYAPKTDSSAARIS